MVEKQAISEVDERPPLVFVTTVSPETKRNARCAPPIPQEEWTCPQCTLLNPERKLYCIACFHRHPDLTPVNLEVGGNTDDDSDDYDLEQRPPFPDTSDRQVAVQDIILGDIDDRSLSSDIILEAHAEEDPFHKKIRRRMRRKRRMMAGGAAGVVAGAVVGSPALAVVGLVGGVVGARVVSKRKERSKDERLAMQRYIMSTKA